MSVDSATEFDPYLTWLNIHEKSRPLNAYQLLGVPLFEQNTQKIHAALKLRKSTLSNFKSRAEPQLFKRLNDELDAALETLLSSQPRAELDAALRRQQAMGSGNGQGAAEAAPDATIRCRCGEINPARRRFCSKCGGQLWRKCAKCSSERAVDEAFCGSCGVNLEEAEQELVSGITSRMEEARSLAAESRFADALWLLHKILLNEDPRLEKQIQEAARLRDELDRQRQQAVGSAAQKYQQASQLLEKNDVAAAAAMLAAIPEPLREPEVQQLYKKLKGSLTAFESHLERLKQLVAENKFQEMAEPIEQLLSIKPDFQPVLNLAGQVRQRACQAARKLVSEHKYAAAMRMLNSIPACARNEQVAQLRQQIAEPDALMRMLARATVVSRAHVRLAERLVKLSGGPQANTLLQAAQRTWQKSGRQPLVQWRPAPQRTPLQCDVRFHCFPQRVAVDEGCAEAAAQAPGQLFVACGLALYGLGISKRKVNLAPEQPRKSFAGLLRRRMSDMESAWGLDIGAHTVKAVHMIKSHSGQPVIKHVHLIRTPDSDEALVLLLKKLAEEHQWKEEWLGVSLPTKLTHIRSIPLPPAKDRDLHKIIKKEAEAAFPIDLEELVWRYEVTDVPDGWSGKQALLAAAKQRVVASRASLLQAAGAEAQVLLPDCLALRDLWRVDAPDSGHSALLDIGAAGATVSIERSGRLWVRAVPAGGDSVTNTLSKELKLTRTQAEQLKRDYCRAQRCKPVFDSLSPCLNLLLREVQRSLEAYEQIEGKRPAEVVCTGGGMLLAGLIDVLRQGEL